MTIPYYLEGNWRVAHLEDIVAEMVQQQASWYDRATAMLGAPPESVVFSPFVFKLAYCYDRVYGTMSWGNWLRLPMNFQWSEDLDDGQIMLRSHPWYGASTVLDIGLLVAVLTPSALRSEQVGV